MISDTINELTYYRLNKKEKTKQMNFDKLQSQLREALLKLDEEIKINKRINDDNIILNNENNEYKKKIKLF